MLEYLMEILNVNSEARILRMGLESLQKAVTHHLPISHLVWLVKKDRRRRYDWK